ncbi:hypothetical protein [Dactylosporangium sp. CA-092794]|uniref:hypothetical protein n=1 Tax=Dactylosporangium sp. CA-092794 TaxID=3239929 RepID=UPI003D92C650
MRDRLARRYRRLMLTYPRAYRRARGDELLATLLEAAPPERARPTVREAADLLRHGLRARLGRPASRSVVTWALLTALISGLFGAAFATRAGWETARPLPAPAETSAMLTEIVPDVPWSEPNPPPGRQFGIYGQSLSWDMRDNLLFGDGGEYSQVGVGSTVHGGSYADPQKAVDEAVANLENHGWTVSPVYRPDFRSWLTSVSARRGDLVLTFEVFWDSTPDTTYLYASFSRTAPPAVWPCGIAGGLLAGLVAFLLFGWASRRVEGRHPAGWVVRVLFGLTLLLWWAPTLFAVTLVAASHVTEPRQSWEPMWEWFGQPTYSLFFVVGGGGALLALALSALPKRSEATLIART